MKITAVLTGLLFLLVAGCSGGGSTGNTDEDVVTADGIPASEIRVNTEVTLNLVPAGQVFGVECKVSKGGVPFEMATEVKVKGPDRDDTIEPGSLTLTTAGIYILTCVTTQGAKSDDTPEEVEVTQGPVVKVVTSIDPDEVTSGGTSEAGCTSFDEFGNDEVLVPDLAFEPSEGISAEEGLITTSTVGTFVVSCKTDEKAAEVESATLVVKAGVPARFRATLEPSQIEAGGQSQVGCEVTDADGNPLEVSWTVEVPANVTAEGKSVTATKAGAYDIKCKPTQLTGNPELTPAKLTVVPGPPVSMAVGALPAKDRYGVGDKVTITHDMVDQYGNKLDAVSVLPVTGSPAEGLSLINELDKFEFLAEGYYDFHVESVDGTQEGDLTLLCDTTPPVLELTYPERGETLTGNPSIIVTGFAQDSTLDLDYVRINGEDVTVNENGYFSFPVTLIHGMNYFAVEAADEGGNLSNTYRSCFYSTDYLVSDFNDSTKGKVDPGLLLFLSQELLDDGDHSLPPDDVATIVELVLADMDFTTMLPEDGIPVGDTCEVTLTSIGYDPPQATIQSLDGGLHITAAIPNLVVSFNFECCMTYPGFPDPECDSYYGNAYADAIVLDAILFLEVAEDGTVTASLGPLDLDFDNLDVEIQGITGPLLEPLMAFFLNTFKDMLIEQAQSQFGDQITQTIEDALASLSQGQVLALPPIGGGESKEVKVAISLTGLNFTFDGVSGRAGLSFSSVPEVDHENLGSIAYDNCGGPAVPAPNLPKDGDLELAAAVDALNQFVWAIWSSGYINVDINEFEGIDLSQYGITELYWLRTDPYYAPVLNICNEDQVLKLQIGDMYVDAAMDILGQHWDFGMFLFLEADIELQAVVGDDGATKIKLDIKSLNLIEFEVVDANEDLQGNEAMLVDMLKGVVPTALEQAKDSLAFALPAIDLSTLAPGIPEGTAVNLDIQSIDWLEGFLFLTGGLK